MQRGTPLHAGEGPLIGKIRFSPISGWSAWGHLGIVHQLVEAGDVGVLAGQQVDHEVRALRGLTLAAERVAGTAIRGTSSGRLSSRGVAA